MQRIFLTLLERDQRTATVTLAVLLKGVRAHVNDLMAFLAAQNITCTPVPPAQRKQLPDYAYFDDMFTITFAAARWSFFELKGYIEAYIASWDEPTVLREDLINRIFSCDEQLVFSDADCVALSKEIDKYEDIYYQQRHSILLFLNNILRLFAKNLRLDWAPRSLRALISPLRRIGRASLRS